VGVHRRTTARPPPQPSPQGGGGDGTKAPRTGQTEIARINPARTPAPSPHSRRHRQSGNHLAPQRKPRALDKFHHRRHGPLTRGQVRDDPALADEIAAHFELRLEQDHRLRHRSAQGQWRGQHLGDRDEADIGDQQVDAFRDDRAIQFPRVLALKAHHPRVAPQARMQLVMPHIDGVNPRGTALQQHLRKPAGGGTDIETGLAGNIDAPGIEPGQQFQRRARYIGRGRILQRQQIGFAHHLVGLFRRLAIDPDRMAQNGVAGPGPAGQQPALFQRQVEPYPAQSATSRSILASAVSLDSS
jgi:hypothetical protein